MIIKSFDLFDRNYKHYRTSLSHDLTTYKYNYHPLIIHNRKDFANFYNLLNIMWIYQNKEITSDAIPKSAIGFLYKITQLSTNKFYYGRKLLTKAKTTQSKGKKIKSRVDSDWKDYWSSSPDLKALVVEKGIGDFKREILMFIDTKASLTYGEEYILYVTGSLFNPDCMNQNIRSKIYRKWFTKTPNIHRDLESLKF